MMPKPKEDESRVARQMQSGIVLSGKGGMSEGPNDRASAQQTSPQAPWLGLRSFTEEDKDYFFGRSAEVNELFERITEHSLTILFGQSGLGKTSLLNAAILPRLRQARFRADCSSFGS